MVTVEKNPTLRRKSMELLKELTQILQEIIRSGDEESLRRLEETIRAPETWSPTSLSCSFVYIRVFVACGHNILCRHLLLIDPGNPTLVILSHNFLPHHFPSLFIFSQAAELRVP